MPPAIQTLARRQVTVYKTLLLLPVSKLAGYGKTILKSREEILVPRFYYLYIQRKYYDKHKPSRLLKNPEGML